MYANPKTYKHVYKIKKASNTKKIPSCRWKHTKNAIIKWDVISSLCAATKKNNNETTEKSIRRIEYDAKIRKQSKEKKSVVQITFTFFTLFVQLFIVSDAVVSIRIYRCFSAWKALLCAVDRYICLWTNIRCVMLYHIVRASSHRRRCRRRHVHETEKNQCFLLICIGNLSIFRCRFFLSLSRCSFMCYTFAALRHYLL